MNPRATIEELLRAGLSDRAIARQLAIPRGRITKARRDLGIPALPTHPRPRAVEDLFWRRVEFLDDGHWKWTGAHNEKGTPVLKHGARDEARNETAYRVAWRLQHSRDPEGLVLPGCGYDQCVRPGHVEDRVLRDQVGAAFTAIFGAVAA